MFLKINNYLYKIFYHLRVYFDYFIIKFLYGNKVNIGKNTSWRSSFKLMVGNDSKLIIGDNCFFNHGCSISVKNSIVIGNHTLFGENVKVYDHNHKFNAKNYFIKQQGFSSKNISIGKNCWICTDVVILKGCHIGDNCIIGAGVVLNENVPDNTIIRCNYQKYISEKINFR